MILIDDQDMNEIATYGGKVYTPNMDRLAAEGIKFNLAYVSSTVCTPSRYSFLTGRYAGRSYSNLYKNEVGENGMGRPGFNVGMENDNMNVAQVLRASGYITGFTGKYHLASQFDQPEMYKGEHAPRNKKSKKDKNLKANSKTTALFAETEAWSRAYLKHIGFDWAKNIYEGNISKPYNVHNPEWNAAAVFEFLDENHKNPFFLQFCPTLLHGPDGEWVKSFDQPNITGAGKIEVPASVMKEREKLRKKLNDLGYDTRSGALGIAWIDAVIGQILDKLETLGIDDNTLVIFAPDHGSTDKASLFGWNGAQIPLLMRWPNGIKAGIESDALVQNIDLVPTYFDIAKAIVPNEYHLDGQSLAPLFKNGKTENWRAHLYFELGYSRAVMTHDWKYIGVRFDKKQVKKIQEASVEKLPLLMTPLQRLGIGVRGADHPGFWDEDQLYNLKQDSEEMKNLAYDADYQRKLTEMKTLLKMYLKDIGRPFGELYDPEKVAANGQIADQINLVKQIEVKGKKVTVPQNLHE
jgi:arylsulfatase A-like enzyme